MAKIILENVSKNFGNVKAVTNLNLQVEDGEFLVLLGPSGCGKTTALRCIAGLERVDGGKIFIGDEDVTDLPSAKRGVSMVFQSYAVFPHMNIFDNIAFGLKLKHTPKDQVEKKVKGAAILLQIEDLLDRYPHQVSGGQRQRVAVARAIVMDPKVYLMDEPLSNLDALLRLTMRAELKLLQRELKTTMIYVTHDQVEAMSMADRVVIMKDGFLQQIDAPEELYNNPKNMFIAGFLGSPPMNMLEGDVVKGDTVIDFGTFTYKPPNRMGERIRKAEISEVVLGVRPEHITIIKEGQENTLRARVDLIEMMGKESYIYLTVGGKSLVVTTSPTQNLGIGEEVWLLLNEGMIHIFDRKTKKTII
ncbi:ABC transporter ATP-binding protein [Dehalococcoidia bacterium]|nr:ABC transporter ATP-binding protein [Dehalococcoidia bacterium]